MVLLGSVSFDGCGAVGRRAPRAGPLHTICGISLVGLCWEALLGFAGRCQGPFSPFLVIFLLFLVIFWSFFCHFSPFFWPILVIFVHFSPFLAIFWFISGSFLVHFGSFLVHFGSFWGNIRRERVQGPQGARAVPGALEDDYDVHSDGKCCWVVLSKCSCVVFYYCFGDFLGNIVGKCCWFALDSTVVTV